MFEILKNIGKKKREEKIVDGIIFDLLDILEQIFMMTVGMLLIEVKCFCFVF